MQREINFSGQENSAASTSAWPFADEDDFSTSLLYSSILPPNRDSFVVDNYLSGAGSSVSPSEGSNAGYWSQIQKQRYQDLMSRYQTILSHFRDVVRLVQDLRQENVNLKMANLDFNNRLKWLLDATPYSGLDLGSVEEEGTSEKSPTSVMDSSRVSLPKSISVRSSGYMKGVRKKEGECSTATNRDKIDNKNYNRTRKVYVKGDNKKMEQGLEVEVYNQGMLKTELCNKWQQTGTCPYGQNCKFAHGIVELRPVLRHARYKTEVCRMVLGGVPCPYGHRCHFRHALTDEEHMARSSWAPQAS
ncbi:Zinc finger CCCH domain-containing protein 15 [Striga hermonthica]|uniref:Zinc finger CCCH domain-containing protein 15 n=1 Tax=Striga hermonthica TaxID=68872 RepID=A0A9N7NA63_STRHE|nr:Zinc finger CCCH domain-containing protein 15 [Striga hermonthica]